MHLSRFAGGDQFVLQRHPAAHACCGEHARFKRQGEYRRVKALDLAGFDLPSVEGERDLLAVGEDGDRHLFPVPVVPVRRELEGRHVRPPCSVVVKRRFFHAAQVNRAEA